MRAAMSSRIEVAKSSECGAKVISVGGVAAPAAENVSPESGDWRYGFSLTSPAQAASNNEAYFDATLASVNTRTWFELTYKPVTEKFVDPVNTFLAPPAS